VPRQKLTALANEVVPFAAAVRWAGLPAVSSRGTKTDCVRCGSSSALRLYDGHGWCFSCQTRFSAVVLLAEVWEMNYAEAAMAALGRIGYAPAGYEARWEQARQPAGLDLPQLGEALKTWCAANIADWEHRQYEQRAAHVLAFCLGLLPCVRTEQDCGSWLARCKQAMQRACSRAMAELPDSG
jgi:hypothetical protein